MTEFDVKLTKTNLDIFNEHIKNNEDYVLKVVTHEGRTYVEATPRGNMTLWDKFWAFFGLSKYNLKNVLDALYLAGIVEKNFMPSQELRDAMYTAGENLRNKVAYHYRDNPEQKEKVIAQVDKVFHSYLKPLPPPYASSVKSQEFPLRMLLRTDFGFNFYGMAIATFEVKTGANGIQYIQPDESILQQCSNQAFQIQNHPTIRNDMMASLQDAWQNHPALLLNYAKNNLAAITTMFKDNPIKISVDISDGSPLLSTEQIDLLKVLPVKALKIENGPEYEYKMTRTLKQLSETIPEMKSLTYVNATDTRHLPKEFYPVLKNLTKFAARMPDEELRHIKEFSKLENLHVDFDNGGSQAWRDQQVTAALQNSQNLQELTLDGYSCRDINVTDYLLMLPPRCSKVRLHQVWVDLENRQLLESLRKEPLDTLCLTNYSEEDIEKFQKAGIAKNIINEHGALHPLEYRTLL